jgi:2',3'-cyclic-nucleotide 2'-phosphodiesterase (5'-nucleotidase family)
MEGIFYFNNELVAFPLTGQQILEILRNAVARADSGDGRFLQVSGMSFSYRRTDGGFEVTGVRIGGKPLDPNATYTAATIDFLYQNGDEDGYMLFTDGRRPPKINVEREADFRAVVEKYIRARGTVDTEIEGRIVRE